MRADILSLIWGLWCAGWLIGGAWSARTVKRESWRSRVPVIVLFALGFIPLFRSRPVWQEPVVFDAGVAITIAGLAFTVWARLHLGRQWSGTVTLKADHQLIRSGPYALVRHPIYTGLLIAVAGTAIAHATIAAFCGFALIAIGCLIKIRVEERLMTEQFGDAYRDYQRDVRMLIPFLWYPRRGP